jgi:hypothetical protein
MEKAAHLTVAAFMNKVLAAAYFPGEFPLEYRQR